MNCKIFAVAPNRGDTFAIIGTDANAGATTYNRFLRSGSFARYFGSTQFMGSAQFAISNMRGQPIDVILKYVNTATAFCRDAAQAVWNSYKTGPIPDDWETSNQTSALALRALLNSTCVTLTWLLRFSGLRVSRHHHVGKDKTPCGVRISDVCEDGVRYLLAFPTSFLVSDVSTLHTSAKMFYYGDERKGVSAMETDDINEVIKVFCGDDVSNKAVPVTDEKSDVALTWRMVDEVSGRTIKWEVQLLSDPILGECSAIITWDTDNNIGSVSLYREHVYVCDIPVGPETYVDKATFKQAAWGTIINRLATSFLSLSTQMGKIMQAYPEG